jgi:uncharacterized lipoprotein YmbA
MEFDWSKFSVDLVNAAMPVLVPMVVALFAAAIGVLINYFKLISAKIQTEKPDEWAIIDKVVKEAVKIAEQLNINGVVQNKMDFAVDYAQNQLDSMGVVLDVEDLKNKLEKAVYDEFTKAKVDIETKVNAEAKLG